MRAVSSMSNKSIRDEEQFVRELYDEPEIQWSDAIFIPFNPIFKLVVLVCVIHKTFLGPLQATFAIITCSRVMDYNLVTRACRYFYTVLANGIYFLDTFLHIVHRQVTDKAMRREHLPKSALLILLDVLSLIPFTELLTADSCTIVIWPNLLSFIEFIVIYRVVEYFEIISTHNYWKLCIGYTVVIALCVNCLTCLFLLLTFHGLCANCRRTDYFYDWRKFVGKDENVSQSFVWYFYGYQYILSYMINYMFNETKPAALLEFFIACILMTCGYVLDIVLLLPKFFSEAVLSLRWISTFHPHVAKLIQETKRRNPSPVAYTSVKNFYNLMWKQCSGIINTPALLTELPRHLRMDIRQDLVWQVFYHSPTLRKTSGPFKRYLSELIRLDYKLPGAKFFAGPHSNTHLYYLKSGIVQLISTDDGSTPLLSVSGGTLFGDISFITPPLRRKISVKCLTYCEVMYITRTDLLKSLHRYPGDRKNVIQLAKEKMRHARTLYSCKKNIKGLDRAEDEGLDWVKRRWWEISDTVDAYKRTRAIERCQVPPEESQYHCAKYLGQLVLCNEAQLKKTSLFVNDKFPWVLAPNSTFCNVWHIFVNIIVLVVLITFPPNLSLTELSPWFVTVKYFTDFVYIADVCVSLCTAIDTKEYETSDFASVMLVRFKKPTFVMDVLAAFWIEHLTILIGKPQYYYSCQFNRLIKIYVLFPTEGRNWSIGQDHIFPVYLRIFISYFAYFYIISFVVFMMLRYIPSLSGGYFFGALSCDDETLLDSQCVLRTLNHVFVAMQFMFEYIFAEVPPRFIPDIAVNIFICYHAFILSTYCKSRFIAGMYLKFRERLSYQRFVTSLRNYYHHLTIHKNLLIRLERYLVSHWKYYHGIDMLRPNSLKDEPFDIFWKVQGEMSEKIIGASNAFVGADRGLVRELAYIAKYLILPRGATLFLFGVLCKNVTWIVQGHVKCEYHNENGVVLKRFYGPGDMVGVTPTILGKPALRTYIASTDCEIIHISVTDFNNVFKRFPQEWAYLNNTITEFSPLFDVINNKYFTEHADYQRKLRDRVFQAEAMVRRHRPVVASSARMSELKNEDKDPYVNPNSNFMKFWMPFRAITVLLSIVTAALTGGGGVRFKKQLNYVKILCKGISLIDIILKVFLAYYDERGILITNRLHTMMQYITHGFLLDVIGFLPWDIILKLLLSKEISEGSLQLINTTAQFAHLYLLTGYFDYLADQPSSVSALIKIAKWQLVTLLLTLASSHYFINNCIKFSFDEDDNVINMNRLDTCWLPAYMVIDEHPTSEQLRMLFAHSINLAQSGLMNINLGKFRIREKGHLLVAIILIVLGVVYWFVMAYSLTVLVLIQRSDTLFQHSVNQLRTFMLAERVETNIMKRTLAHFSYWWIRTKGINIHTLTYERMGVIFKQDLSFYFYKTTYAALDTLLEGGEQFQRQLASQSLPMYVLPHEEIMREMDLMPYIFVVHRGKVVVSQDGEKLAVLTKGGIFGQLSGTIPRPVKVSVHADDYTDILKITIKQFDEAVTLEIRKNIKNNIESQFDFMATKKAYHENPYQTIKYILRGRKTIKMPWMLEAKEAHRGNLYYRWLYVAWLFEPAATAFMTTVIFILPADTASVFMWFFVIPDLVHLTQTVTEYFTLDIMIAGEKCILRKVGHRIFKDWRLYMNIFSLIVPYLTFTFGYRAYQIARLARLYYFYEFHVHFCRTFKSQWSSIALKFLILTLLVHSMACGWILCACRTDEFPVPLPLVPPAYNKTIDFGEWTMADQRPGGCARITRNFKGASGSWRVSFVVPKNWYADYIIALTFILLLLSHTTLDTVMQVSATQIYYKIFITVIIHLVDIWLMSVACGAIYTKFRELYQYDFNVKTLKIYLENSGLSPSLIRSVMEYTRHLWDRQRGNWLPELAHQAPDCLREDILGALYLHHILTPPMFRQLPQYFTRQMVARARRVVIFPGKCIVQEGDINSIVYFIHEGEVEKWYNYGSSEKKLASILTTNGYFGLIPGLFPSTRFQFTFYSRTVVDLVYLRLSEWRDLINAYPDVKATLYGMAIPLKAKEYKNDEPPIY